MIAAERETTIAYTDADEFVSIYTCRRQDITTIRKKLDKGVILEREGTHADGTPFAYFKIPSKRFSVSRAVQHAVTLTPEERGRRAERMRFIRNPESGDVLEEVAA